MQEPLGRGCNLKMNLGQHSSSISSLLSGSPYHPPETQVVSLLLQVCFNLISLSPARGMCRPSKAASEQVIIYLCLGPDVEVSKAPRICKAATVLHLAFHPAAHHQCNISGQEGPAVLRPARSLYSFRCSWAMYPAITVASGMDLGHLLSILGAQGSGYPGFIITPS